MTKTISVIGLGKLGAPMAACFATRGFGVLGVEQDARKVEAMNHAIPPVFEPRLDELLRESKGRFLATRDVEAAVLDTEVSPSATLYGPRRTSIWCA